MFLSSTELQSLPSSELPPQGWQASGGASKNLQCSLLPTSSTTFTNMLSASATSLLPISMNVINSPHLLIRHSLVQALHPITDVTGRAEGQVDVLYPGGCPGFLAFVFFSKMASTIALWPSCTVCTVASTWAVLPAQVRGPLRPSSTSCAFLLEKPLTA